MLENGVEREDCLFHVPDDVEYTSPDEIFMKGMLMKKAGTVVGQHAHEYHHTSLLVSGSVRLWCNGVSMGDYKAPCFMSIIAKMKHEFLSLEDNTHIYCIHNMSHQTGIKPSIHEENTLPRGGA